eukprot:m.6103 g.6103  ORF g.6103 m.6103 type:complete len:79 (-) comp5845_c0_seq2:445-681(-)
MYWVCVLTSSCQESYTQRAYVQVFVEVQSRGVLVFVSLFLARLHLIKMQRWAAPHAPISQPGLWGITWATLDAIDIFP